MVLAQGGVHSEWADFERLGAAIITSSELNEGVRLVIEMANPQLGDSLGAAG